MEIDPVLEATYSGGQCGPLSLFLNAKFHHEIYCITGTTSWDGKKCKRGPYHYFVGSFLGKGYNYFDIFGWTNSITNILSNFTEFKNEDELNVQKCTKEFVTNKLHRYNYKQFEVENDWPKIEKIYKSEIITEPYKGRILEYKFINELLK